jgi:hypothetical protein
MKYLTDPKIFNYVIMTLYCINAGRAVEAAARMVRGT